MPPPPTPPKLLTTAELAQATAGGDDYIRTKHKKVRGLAYDPKRNPHAPKVPGEPGKIVFGIGPRRSGRARLFLESQVAAPTYVKRDTDAWEYIGEYRAVKILRDKATIEKYRGSCPADTQAGVLFIESVFEPELQVSCGGFGDPETRKAVEAAAIAFVTYELEQREFQVKDVQREKRGYDLLAVSPSGTLLIEVKGTDYLEPRFFLTRKERRCSSEQGEWRLFVVCNARSAPVLHEYTAKDMYSQFAFDPLAWECTRKDS